MINNFLANGGTELNTTSNLYDLDFRNYDPALGRMYGVDPMASKYSSLTPYNYSFNNPVTFNDVNGADPYTINYSATTSQYHTGYTYDDRIDPTNLSEAVCGQCWRMETSDARSFFGAPSGSWQSRTFAGVRMPIGGNGVITRSGNTWTINWNQTGEHGAQWNWDSGSRNFTSGEQALFAGMSIVERTNSWSHTQWGSASATLALFPAVSPVSGTLRYK